MTVGVVAVVMPSVAIALALGSVVAAALAATRLAFIPLLVTWIWSLSLVHLAKRAIYFAGPQPQWTYYAVLAAPGILAVILASRAAAQPDFRGARRATIALAAFAAMSTVSTLLPSSTPLLIRLASVEQKTIAMLGFIIGLAVPAGSIAFFRATRAIVVAAAVSVPYGLYQLSVGPGPLEIPWARSTAAYSIQALNVVKRLEGTLAEWRGFSYYADPLTWGLFLFAAIGLEYSRRELGESKVGSRRVLVALLYVGMFACFTRTPWLGLASTLAGFALLGWRPARRPIVLVTAAAVSFLAIIAVGSFLYFQVFPSVMGTSRSSAAASRYLTVGTVEARLGAPAALPTTLNANRFVGKGAAFTTGAVTNAAGTGGEDAEHNVLVELAYSAGTPGLAFFCWFIFTVFKAGITGARFGATPRASRWLVSLVFGLLVTGYTNGGTFLSEWFFLLCGIVVASSERSDSGDSGGVRSLSPT